MDIKKVFIVGSGLMGSGIAQVCAQRGLEVVLYDIDGEALKRALKGIEWSVGKFIEKENTTNSWVHINTDRFSRLHILFCNINENIKTGV